MLVQHVFSIVAFATVFTLVNRLSQVHSLVAFECTARLNDRIADVTSEEVFSFHMDVAFVGQDVIVRLEGLSTDVAIVIPLFRMGLFMLHE